MNVEKLDPQWVLAQGIAVFLCVMGMIAFCTVGARFLFLMVKEMRAMNEEIGALRVRMAQMEVEYAKAIGKMAGAIRWLGQWIQEALNLEPPKSPDDGFRDDPRTTKVSKPTPGARHVSTPTPTPKPIHPSELEELGDPPLFGS